MKLAARALLVLLAALLLGFQVSLVYFHWFEPPWLTYVNVPFPAGVSVPLGGRLPVTITRCSSAAVERDYRLTRTLRNVQTGESWEMYGSVAPVKPGCSTVEGFSEIAVIQDRMQKPPAPGLYVVQGFAEIEATARTILIPWSTEPFSLEAP